MSDIRTPQVAAMATPALAMLERVSWGAVIPRAVIALAVLMALNGIGLAIGLYAVDASRSNLGAGEAATLTGVWWAVSALFTLFIGGWVSSRLAGNPDLLVSGIHGAAVLATLGLTLAAAAVGGGLAGRPRTGPVARRVGEPVPTR